MFTIKTGPTCPHCGSLVIPVRGCVNGCKEETMKTAREVARAVVCTCVNTANEAGTHVPRCDRRTERAAREIEADRRALVEACEYEALLAGNPCGHDPCSHSTCTTARSAAARIRALIPREDSRG